VEQRQPGSAPTISFVPALGDEFLVLLTPSRDPGRLDFNSPARVRAFVERSGQGMLGGSVEKAVALESLSGTTAQGFYYTLTDRAAVGKPSVRGDYPYVTQGAVATGDLLVVFSIFHRTKDDPERQAALVMVAGLRQQGKGAAGQGPAGSGRLPSPCPAIGGRCGWTPRLRRAQRRSRKAAKGAVHPTMPPWARTMSSVARLNSGK